MHRKLPIIASFVLLFSLVGCGGGGPKVDYSSNQFIRSSTTYYCMTDSHTWFTFKSDGTGKASWGGDNYDVSFTMSSDTTASVSWGPFKNEKATFRHDEKTNFLSLAGYQYMTYNL